MSINKNQRDWIIQEVKKLDNRIDRYERELERIPREIQALKDRRSLLNGQLMPLVEVFDGPGG